MSDELIDCTQVRCTNCDNVVFVMTDENSTPEFRAWVYKDKANIACVKCLQDHVSKSKLREWCEEEINNMSKRYRLGWDGAMMAVLERFCKEAN